MNSLATWPDEQPRRAEHAAGGWTVLVGLISLMVLGCATDPSAATSEAVQRARKERQQRLEADWRLSREHGRIGYVGNQAPALEGTTVPPAE